MMYIGLYYDYGKFKKNAVLNIKTAFLLIYELKLITHYIGLKRLVQQQYRESR